MKKHPVKLTAEWLTANLACQSQVGYFRTEFPKGCRVTLANLKRAQDVSLEIAWLARKLFSTAEYRRYCSLYWTLITHYDEAIAFWRVYKAAKAKGQPQ